MYEFSIPQHFWCAIWFIGMVHKLRKVSGMSTINSAEKKLTSDSVFQKLNFEDKFAGEKLIQRKYEPVNNGLQGQI